MDSEQWMTQKDGGSHVAEGVGRFDRHDRRRIDAWDEAGTCLAGQAAAAGDAALGNNPDQYRSAMGEALYSQEAPGDHLA